MASTDSLALLEQKRQQLEAQVSELDKALNYWRSWETDYELLKETLEDASQTTNDTDLNAVVRCFAGTVLNKEEIKKLLTDDKGTQRTRAQVLELLRHRLDYVRGNVDTIGKRRDAADNKLLGIDVLLKPDMVDEEGLPLTEITEELDEEGNVVSSSTRNTAEDAPALMEKLESQGLTDKALQSKALNAQLETMSDKFDAAKAEAERAEVENFVLEAPTSDQGTAQTTSTRAAMAEALARAKADQLSASLEDDSDEGEPGESAMMATARLLSSISDVDPSNMSDLGPSLKMKDPSNFRSVPRSSLQREGKETAPVIPTNESPEDAALRREMLAYSFNEVGAVVAEMDIDELDDEDEDDDDYDYDDEDENEDEYGRSRQPIISDEYRQQMLDLEKQLDAKALQNLGPAPGRISPETSDDEKGGEGSLPKTVPKVAVVSPAPEPAVKKDKKAGKTKGVRFADDLDIAEEKNKSATPDDATEPATAKSEARAANPLSDEIQERKPRVKLSVSAEPNPRKISRFKAARAPNNATQASSGETKAAAPRNGPLSESSLERLKPMVDDRAQRFAGALLSMTADKPRYTPEGPPGKTLGDVVEKPASENPVLDPGEDDAGLTRQALAAEYYRQRNNKIYQQGGFQAHEPAVIPLDENGEEIRPNVSRFKASRLGNGGNQQS